MVILPAVMTEYDNGQGAFSASAFVADIATPSHISGVTDTLQVDALFVATPSHISGVIDTFQVDELIVSAQRVIQDAARSVPDF